MCQEQRISLGLAAACLVAVVGLGCESNRDLSPAAPTAITSGGFQSESAGSSSGFTSARPTPKPETSKVHLRGPVANLGGSCPTVSFTLGSVSVQTTNATKYGHGTCADVKNDATVNVEGTKGSDGVVTAKEIEVKGRLQADKTLLAAQITAPKEKGKD